MIALSCKNISDLPTTARSILRYAADKKIILFMGAMGSGKTTLIKQMCLELGVNENISSPTFALVNEYRDAEKNIIYHFDFYRLKSESEAFDLGYEEYFYSGNKCLIEWPEKIPNLIPASHFIINLKVQNDGERIFELNHSS